MDLSRNIKEGNIPRGSCGNYQANGKGNGNPQRDKTFGILQGGLFLPGTQLVADHHPARAGQARQQSDTDSLQRESDRHGRHFRRSHPAVDHGISRLAHHPDKLGQDDRIGRANELLQERLGDLEQAAEIDRTGKPELVDGPNDQRTLHDSGG
ncbi:hypothetical protein D1872_284790 [compost metagenome]